MKILLLKIQFFKLNTIQNLKIWQRNKNLVKLVIITISFSISDPNRSKRQPHKQSNRLKQFVSNLPTNCLTVFDHFVGLALKGLTKQMMKYYVKPGHCIPSIRRSYIGTSLQCCYHAFLSSFFNTDIMQTHSGT